MKTLPLIVGCLTALGSLAAHAESPRIAVHPLAVRGLSSVDQGMMQAFFEVSMAKVKGVRLAGSARVEDVLDKSSNKDCAGNDTCLSQLAAATESAYAVYASIVPDGAGRELSASARVVRADGAVVRKVTLNAPILKEMQVTETGHELLSVLVKSMELEKLSDAVPLKGLAAGPGAIDPVPFPGPSATTAPAAPVIAQVTPAPVPDSPRAEAPAAVSTATTISAVPPPLVPAESSLGITRARNEVWSARRTVGMTMVGAGTMTLGAGAVLLGMAVNTRKHLTVDETGAVPANEAVKAATAARQTQIATVMMPVGAAVGVVGAVLALWPDRSSTRISAVATPAGGAVSVTGSLP